MSVGDKIEKLIEEAKVIYRPLVSDKLTPEERIAASGGAFIHTGNPEDTFFKSLGPVKGEAISKEDLDHRARQLGLSRDFVERNMAIRTPDGSGYNLDRGKLAGFMSRQYPDEITFGKTNGKPTRLLAQGAALSIPATIIGAAKGGVAFGPPGAALGAGVGLGIGGMIGGGLNTVNQNIVYKQGQNLHDRMKKKNFRD